MTAGQPERRSAIGPGQHPLRRRAALEKQNIFRICIGYCSGRVVGLAAPCQAWRLDLSHAIVPEEAEEAVLIEPLEADVQSHKDEPRVLCFGRTKSGRLLTILYTERHGKVRVVTAYEMTKPQQQMYFEGKSANPKSKSLFQNSVPKPQRPSGGTATLQRRPRS
jgi:uncharacterized DUF497 family protein